MGRSLPRRAFLGGMVVSGVAINIAFRSRPAQAALIDTPQHLTPSWIGPNGKPRFRMEAIAKVTGDKTFARDFRARDMPGWPAEQSHALLIRATRADAAFDGLDLSALGTDLQPDRLVLGEDLLHDGLAPPSGAVVTAMGFYGDMLLVPKGRTPRLLGQPVALLVYKDFARFDAAKRRIRFDISILRWGPVTGYDGPEHYGAARFVRIGGATPDDPDVYAPLDGTVVHAGFEGDKVAWPQPSAIGDAAARAMWAAAEIETAISPRRAPNRSS
jgi:hypothetical protein